MAKYWFYNCNIIWQVAKHIKELYCIDHIKLEVAPVTQSMWNLDLSACWHMDVLIHQSLKAVMLNLTTTNSANHRPHIYNDGQNLPGCKHVNCCCKVWNFNMGVCGDGPLTSFWSAQKCSCCWLYFQPPSLPVDIYVYTLRIQGETDHLFLFLFLL